MERGRKDSYKGMEEKEKEGKKWGKGREGEGGEKKREGLRSISLPSDLGERGKSSMSWARRKRALPSRVDHGHVSTGAELGRKSLGQTSAWDGERRVPAYIPVVLRDLELLDAFRLN